MTEKRRLFLGVDPGWKNLGFSVLELVDPKEFKFKIRSCTTFNPSENSLSFATNLPIHVIKTLQEELFKEFSLKNLTMERFVPYKGVQSAESENILILTGNIQMMFHLNNPVQESGLNALLVRAIDWKIQMVQFLNKYFNFENPSAALDKKFSIKAAQSIVTNPELIKTDHEADSICIAAYPFISEFVQNSKT